MSRADRVANANAFLRVIGCFGRRFFHHEGRFAEFYLGFRNCVWFVDHYSEQRIYTHNRRGRWRGFTNGGTLRELVESLRDYIMTGGRQRLNLGPWPHWIADGDLWGYGDDMQIVRDTARRLGITPEGPP